MTLQEEVPVVSKKTLDYFQRYEAFLIAQALNIDIRHLDWAKEFYDGL